jgi:deoxyribodipyrimidine photo-lyase
MNISLVWLRKDLRIRDNLALLAAQKASHVLPFYCLDPNEVDVDFVSGRSQRSNISTYKLQIPKTGIYRGQFLLQSLSDLRSSLRANCSDLVVFRGEPSVVIEQLVQHLSQNGSQVNGLFYQKEVSSEEVETENRVESVVNKWGLKSVSVWGSTMYHVDDLPFHPKDCPDVFTEFRKLCESKSKVRSPLETPKKLKPFPRKALGRFVAEYHQEGSVESDDSLVGQIPKSNDRETSADISFHGGESVALARLHYYTFEGRFIDRYKETRNGLLGMDYSSKLSPWLSLGCLSPRYVYSEIKRYEQTHCANEGTYWLFFELLWRDFWKIVAQRYGNGLFHLHGPKLLRKGNYHREWKRDMFVFERWMAGSTGIPFVDAAMRELAQTGYMSNRSRQNVASFLVHQINDRFTP